MTEPFSGRTNWGKKASRKTWLLGLTRLAIKPSLTAVPAVAYFDEAALVEPDDANFRYGASYFGIARSDDLVMIQITASNTRTQEQKKMLFRRIAALLGESPGIRSEDVFVSLVEVAKENWSLGNGLAQYA